jgi:hypothetical protein
MAGAHLPFGQHATRQGVAMRDSRRCQAGALEGCREGKRGDDTQEREGDGDAAGGRRGDDGVDRWVMVARSMVDCGDTC